MATATVTANPAPETYKLELLGSQGNVFRDVLRTPPRDCDISEIPIIDLATINGSDEQCIALADAFRAAAENNGFFYIKNHGIPEAKIQASFKQARTFFAQPVEKKALVSRNQSLHHNGWTERHGTKISPSEKVDHKEGFSWRYHPKYDPKHSDLEPVPDEVQPWIRGEDFVWEKTSNLPGFKEDVLGYWQECLGLARRMIRIFALALNVPENYFDHLVTYPGSDGVFNYYPKSSDAASAEVDVGLGAHTDLQCFTLLWQDQVGGLQVLTKEGQWLNVPPIPGTFVVNIGDFLMRLSNDQFQSTVHRVFNHAPEDRYSMPFFFGFNWNEQCSVIPTCADDSNPPKYKPVSCGECGALKTDKAPDTVGHRLNLSPSYKTSGADSPGGQIPYGDRNPSIVALRPSSMSSSEHWEAQSSASERPEPSMIRKRPATATDDDHNKKPRRRRVFSCESCQRLKCKCDWDHSMEACRRCITLRISCSLRESHIQPDSRPMVVSVVQAIQEKLQVHGEALAEIQTLLRSLSNSHGQRLANEERFSQKASNVPCGSKPARCNASDVSDAGSEDLSFPADRAINAAPVVVLREIGVVYKGGPRRSLRNANLDLVANYLLDEKVAEELIRIFFRYHNCSQFISESISSVELRKRSALLHGACCLQGIAFREDIRGSVTHRQIYERVRGALGQALLISPLTLDEIYAIMIMSENVTDPSGDEREYIDSWLLTGYAAKQAMLTVDFSKIVERIKRGCSTSDDQRAVRLWATVCIQHFHWATTTGRPPVIRDAYISQCNILFSFYNASISDGLLLAEIGLFSQLQHRIGAYTPADVDVEEEFSSWKLKWNHLLSSALPVSSKLRMSYHIACLILAVRSLEELGEGLRSKAFLSDEPSPTTNRSKSSKDARSRLRVTACRNAQAILEKFLDMPTDLKDVISTNACMCLGYGMYILSHYDESQSGIPDRLSLKLATGLEEWCNSSPGRMWVTKYGVMAKRKLQARMSGSRVPLLVGLEVQTSSTEDTIDGIDINSADQRSPIGYAADTGIADSGFHNTAQGLVADSSLTGFSTNDIFTNMEAFFGGGLVVLPP